MLSNFSLSEAESGKSIYGAGLFNIQIKIYIINISFLLHTCFTKHIFIFPEKNHRYSRMV